MINILVVKTADKYSLFLGNQEHLDIVSRLVLWSLIFQVVCSFKTFLYLNVYILKFNNLAVQELYQQIVNFVMHFL